VDKEKLKEGLMLFSKEERDVLMGAPVDLVGRLSMARRRAWRRYLSDARTDPERRVLVGARVPRALYDRVKACAAARGVSLYRLVIDTLEHMCENEGV